MKKKNDTPASLKPSANETHWTIQEKKMLDQITIEIQEAWKNDLINMRKYYSKMEECRQSLNQTTNLLEERLEQVERLTSSSGLINLLEVLEKQKHLAMFMDEIRKEVFDMKNQLKFENVQEIFKHTKAIKDLLNEIHKKQSERKWWEFWK